MKGYRKHEFVIIKVIEAPMSNVVANYLDVEHIPVHPGINELHVLAESHNACSFTLESTILGIPMSSINYFEFDAPDRVVQVTKSPVGPMRTVSVIKEHTHDDGRLWTQVDVTTTLWMRPWFYIFRYILEKILRKTNKQVLDEDAEILDRRAALVGDYVEDFCRDEQPMLFKELFVEHFSKKKANQPND